MFLTNVLPFFRYKIFHADDYELHYLQKNQCPFCRSGRSNTAWSQFLVIVTFDPTKKPMPSMFQPFDFLNDILNKWCKLLSQVLKIN